MKNLTVRQIAERIRRPHEDIATVVDRIRGWTDVGLLEVLGEKNPGTGKRRRYQESAIIDALVLTTLVDAGLAAVRVGQFQGADGKTILQLCRLAAKEAHLDGSLGRVRYLVIAGRAPSSNLPPSVYVYEGTASTQMESKTEPAWPAGQAIVVPLRRREHVNVVHDAAWAIVLNLTDLFSSLSGTETKYHLVVRYAFAGRRKGDRIDDEREINEILNSEHRNCVVRAQSSAGG